MSPIPVVFCFDTRYAEHAAVSMASVIASATSPVKLYALVPQAEIDKMGVVNRVNAEVTVIGVDNSVFTGWKTGHVSLAAYLRLLIPDYIPESRAIYLDCDTMTIGDLMDLYTLDLGSNLIGAMGGKGRPSDTRVPRSKDDNYVNSGVLLMDLDVLREDKFSTKCRDIYNTYTNQIIWHDQCVLNKYAECRKLLIDPKWNYKLNGRVDEATWERAKTEAKIMHFTMNPKPWSQIAAPHVRALWGHYKSLLKQPAAACATLWRS